MNKIRKYTTQKECSWNILSLFSVIPFEKVNKVGGRILDRAKF